MKNELWLKGVKRMNSVYDLIFDGLTVYALLLVILVLFGVFVDYDNILVDFLGETLSFMVPTFVVLP